MSAVETGERIGLPQNKPAAERVSLPMGAPPAPEPPAPVSLTARGARAFGEILAGKGEPYGALKVAVMGGGCAGNQYAMAIARAPEPTDVVLEVPWRGHLSGRRQRPHDGRGRDRFHGQHDGPRLHGQKPQRGADLRLRQFL